MASAAHALCPSTGTRRRPLLPLSRKNVQTCNRNSALLGFRVSTNTCWVRAYDTRACKWHAFSIDSIPVSYAASMKACDAGLVCFVPWGDAAVLVCNPLTRAWRQLPLQRLKLHQPLIVQLRVDRDRGSYRVILVGHLSHEQSSGMAAEVYDSEKNEWSAMVSGQILGKMWYQFEMSAVPRPIPVMMVYDCSTGELCEYRRWIDDLAEYRTSPRREIRDADGFFRTEWLELGFANHLNDLYVLEALSDEYALRPDEHVWFDDEEFYTEYDVLKYEDGQWGFGSDGLPRFDRDPLIFKFEMQKMGDWCGPAKLFVCKSFFLAVSQDLQYPQIQHLVLYDMEDTKEGISFSPRSTDKWHSVSREEMQRAVFCELRWNACP